MIDLRSDTVTKPTAEMLDFMMRAEVGDDVWDDDPTVHALQDLASEIMGKEAALFVVSGTMANQLAIKVNSKPGDEIIVEADAHPVHHEAGATGLVSGVTLRPVSAPGGVLTPGLIEPHIRPYTRYYADTSMVLMENTHNKNGGVIYPLEKMREVYELARGKELAVHIDGARIFNASVAAGVPVSDYATCCDTVSFCLSKGLGAPVGSILAGSAAEVRRAIKYRTMLGGGWRQAGILAAGGIYALKHNVTRLAEDHANAALFARLISEIEGVELRETPATNMVFFKLRGLGARTEDMVERWGRLGLHLATSDAQYTVRAVFHLHITEADVRTAARIMADTLS